MRNTKTYKLMMLIAVNLALLILICNFCTLRSYAINLGENGERIAALQKHLKEKGYYDGKINGLFDFSTRRAVKKFQNDSGLTDANISDSELISSLGINPKVNRCYSAEVEILAKHLKTKGIIEYHNMVTECENVLENSKNSSLYSYILAPTNDIYAFMEEKPNSEQYAAAYETVKIYELY